MIHKIVLLLMAQLFFGGCDLLAFKQSNFVGDHPNQKTAEKDTFMITFNKCGSLMVSDSDSENDSSLTSASDIQLLQNRRALKEARVEFKRNKAEMDFLEKRQDCLTRLSHSLKEKSQKRNPHNLSNIHVAIYYAGFHVGSDVYKLDIDYSDKMFRSRVGAVAGTQHSFSTEVGSIHAIVTETDTFVSACDTFWDTFHAGQIKNVSKSCATLSNVACDQKCRRIETNTK